VAVWLLGALLAGTITAPATASVQQVEWHRYNPYDPSHERLRCVTDGEWRCMHDSPPEPNLGFIDPEAKATFVGTDVTATWKCPTWRRFPREICASAVRVISGEETFVFTGGDDPFPTFTVEVELIVLADGTMWNYWVRPFGTFVCPWYPTFEQALASPAECVFAAKPIQ